MAWPLLFDALKWFAVGFLLWLAWKIATSGTSGPARERPIAGFWQADAFQWLNPQSWVVTASAAGAFLATGSGALGLAVWLGCLFILAALACCLAWLAFAATAQRVLQTDRARLGDGDSAGRVGAALRAVSARATYLGHEVPPRDPT